MTNKQKADVWAMCQSHAKHCYRCSHPIIDAEGNPGYFSEACLEGLGLLARYCRLNQIPVPRWVQEGGAI